MAVPPALVAVVQFDPPTISIVGPIKDATVAKLNMILPMLTRNVGSARRDPPVFKSDSRLAMTNWVLSLKGCLTDEPARMAFIYALLKCLEEEGGWAMRDSLGNSDELSESNTFFFTNSTMK